MARNDEGEVNYLKVREETVSRLTVSPKNQN